MFIWLFINIFKIFNIGSRKQKIYKFLRKRSLIANANTINITDILKFFVEFFSFFVGHEQCNQSLRPFFLGYHLRDYGKKASEFITVMQRSIKPIKNSTWEQQFFFWNRCFSTARSFWITFSSVIVTHLIIFVDNWCWISRR